MLLVQITIKAALVDLKMPPWLYKQVLCGTRATFQLVDPAWCITSQPEHHLPRYIWRSTRRRRAEGRLTRTWEGRMKVVVVVTGGEVTAVFMN